MFIAFLGCDGSGKSAVISGLVNHEGSHGRKVILGHWRPKPLMAEASNSLMADNPHGQQPRGILSSFFKLIWLLLNWRLAWWKGLAKQSRDGLVIFDRYHADLLVDPLRYRYGGPMWLASLVMTLMPQPQYVFFLDAEPDVLLSRKQEVSRESLEASRRKYLAMCQSHKRFHVIDASQSIDEVVENVLAIVS